MSGLNNDDDETLDNVDSLINRIKGKKSEEPQVPKNTDSPLKASTAGGSSASGIGDFAALRKKMETAKPEEPAPPLREPSVTPRTPPASPHDDLEFSDADDLQEKFPQSPQMSQKAPSEPDALMEGKDVRQSLGKLLGGMGTNQTAAPPPGNETAHEEVIEIIDEDPKAAVRNKAIKNAVLAPPAAGQVTNADQKIVNVDQISEISGLILPKGVSFKVEELKLHGRISAFEGSGTLPPDFDEIWKKNFSTAGFKDLDIAEAAAEVKPRIEAKKFGLSRLFKAVHATIEEYDPKKHGPLVDISFKPQPGVEEVEIYPVNPPYAYIQIIYDLSLIHI